MELRSHSETDTLNSGILEGIIDHCFHHPCYGPIRKLWPPLDPDEGMCSNQDDRNPCKVVLQKGPHTASIQKAQAVCGNELCSGKAQMWTLWGFSPCLEEVVGGGLTHSSTDVH